MKTRGAALLLVLLLPLISSCTSAGPEPDARGRMRPDRRGAMPRMAMGGPGLTLPQGWWHDPRLVEPLALTPEQFSKLDALQTRQEDASKLERDLAVAMHELRNAIDTRGATAADIVSAGAHYRALQATLLEQQIALLAAQREILTPEQWSTLQRELTEELRPERGEFGGRGGMRGRGGMGGGGGMRPPRW